MDTSEHFKLFVERAGELRNTRLVQSGGPRMSLSMKWNHEDELLRIESTKPNEDDLKAFLLTFRQFFMDRDPVFLGRIFSLLQQWMTDDHLKGEVVKAREHWKACIKGAGIEVAVDDVRMTPEHVTKVMINGLCFHNDQRYRK